MKTKICISGYYGFDNFGDETILRILIENLKKNSKSIEITVFSSNPEKTSSLYNVNSVKSFNIFKVISSLFKCDFLISGGGSLLQDVTSKKSLIYYLAIIFIALLFKKKVIIFAQGIGPVNNKFLENITVFILKRVKNITVRDENSLNLLNSWGIKAKKCPDPVWNLNIKPKNQQTNKIGIQLRSCKSINENFLSLLASQICTYYKNKEINILSFQNSLDLEICNKLKKYINMFDSDMNVKVIENTSNQKIIEDTASLDELIAMRFHACLIAIKSNVKLLPINYDIKVEQLAKDFNLNYLNIDSDTNEIINVFKEFTQSEIVYDNNKIINLKYNFESLLLEN